MLGCCYKTLTPSVALATLAWSLYDDHHAFLLHHSLNALSGNHRQQLLNCWRNSPHLFTPYARLSSNSDRPRKLPKIANQQMMSLAIKQKIVPSFTRICKSLWKEESCLCSTIQIQEYPADLRQVKLQFLPGLHNNDCPLPGDSIRKLGKTFTK